MADQFEQIDETIDLFLHVANREHECLAKFGDLRVGGKWLQGHEALEANSFERVEVVSHFIAISTEGSAYLVDLLRCDVRIVLEWGVDQVEMLVAKSCLLDCEVQHLHRLIGAVFFLIGHFESHIKCTDVSFDHG